MEYTYRVLLVSLYSPCVILSPRYPLLFRFDCSQPGPLLRSENAHRLVHFCQPRRDEFWLARINFTPWPRPVHRGASQIDHNRQSGIYAHVSHVLLVCLTVIRGTFVIDERRNAPIIASVKEIRGLSLEARTVWCDNIHHGATRS